MEGVRRFIAPVVVSVGMFGGLAVGGNAALDLREVATAPEHADDIRDLAEYTSPDGDDARCATETSLDFQRALREVPLEEADREVFATVLADKGMELHGRPVTAEDLEELSNADLSKVPGFDCGAEGGASTHVVLEAAENKAPVAILGILAATATAVATTAFALGKHSGKKTKKSTESKIGHPGR